MKKINSQYQKMITQVKIDADKFVDEQMKTVYKNQKDHLTELHKYLGLLFIGYAIDGELKVTSHQKSNILSGLDSKLIGMARDMGNTEISQVTDILKKNYSDVYYKNAYIMDSGLNINLKFDLLKKEYIDAAVNNPIDGELFSDRIWANKTAVADKVKQGIVDAMNGNTTIDKLGRDIQRTFNVGAYESQRLVNTENARVQAQAVDDIGKNVGCTQQMYCATLEHNTCAECAELDGKYYDIDDDNKPNIPLHPNCRCLYINVPFDDWKPTARKDNESKDIIDYEDYNKWAKEKNIDDNVLNEKSGKDFDSKVNWDIVEAEEYKNKFAGIGGNENVDNEIYKTATRILRHRDGTKYEDLYIMDLNSGKTITYTTQNTEMGIKRNLKLDEILSRKGANYAIIHNHPHSSSFSESDLKTLFDSESVKKMLAVGHDGTVYTINSKELAIDVASEYKMRYTKVKKYGFSDDTAMEKAMKITSELYGLGYERR